jgi:hypothetical protein
MRCMICNAETTQELFCEHRPNNGRMCSEIRAYCRLCVNELVNSGAPRYVCERHITNKHRAMQMRHGTDTGGRYSDFVPIDQYDTMVNRMIEEEEHGTV